MLQCLASPDSQPSIERKSNCVSSRSDFARRCSRDTGMLFSPRKNGEKFALAEGFAIPTMQN